jgi:hypothetical protein
MKRKSLTKCLQLAHDFNDQEVIDLLSSKYRVAKVIVAQINVPPVPGRESWALYQYNNFSSSMGGGPVNLVEWYMKTFPASPLISEGSLLEKLEDKVRHVELWLEYEADQKSSSVTDRRDADKIYAEKYKAEIDPTWNVGTPEDPKNPIVDPSNEFFIHEYIRSKMTSWYDSLYPNDKQEYNIKTKKGIKDVDVFVKTYYIWWDSLDTLYTDNERVKKALNANHTVYLEPSSGTYAKKHNKKIVMSEIDIKYTRMIQKQISLRDLGDDRNKFPYYGPSNVTIDKVDYTYHNPNVSGIDSLIMEFQNALLGIEQAENKKQKDIDITGPLNFLTNLMNYKGGRI